MAKTSMIEKNNRREQKAKLFKPRRDELRSRSKDINLTFEQRFEAGRALEKLPRDSSPSRYRLRCELSGRPRGNYRKFRLSRMAFRQLALEGKLPGVTKASW